MKHPIYALTDAEAQWILTTLFNDTGNRSRKGYEEWREAHKFVNSDPADKDVNGLKAYLAQHFIDLDEKGVKRFKMFYKQSQAMKTWKPKKNK